MMYGILNLSFWGYVLATLLFTHITIVSVTIYLHRNQAHRALNLHPVISHFFRFWIWLTTSMITQEWVAIHRKHHAFTETENDPHSPQTRGLRKVLLEGAELYSAEAKNQETIEKYNYGTPNDWIERHLYARNSSLNKSGIALMFLLDLLLFGVPGITIWAFQMMCIPVFAAGVVNGIGHFWGYRNFECPDASRNIVPFGILLGGEELHNNHHSAKLSSKWWEIDIGYLYIRMLTFFGLAEIKKLPPRLVAVQGKASVDLETVKALFSNRFQILSRYYKDVVTPVYKEEKQRANAASQKLFKRASKLLIREKSLMNRKAKHRLACLIREQNKLKLVYRYRLKLQAIWDKTATSQKELVDSLQQWCKQAEATGIDVLIRFANNLKSYVNVSPIAVVEK